MHAGAPATATLSLQLSTVSAGGSRTIRCPWDSWTTMNEGPRMKPVDDASSSSHLVRVPASSLSLLSQPSSWDRQADRHGRVQNVGMGCSLTRVRQCSVPGARRAPCPCPLLGISTRRRTAPEHSAGARHHSPLASGLDVDKPGLWLSPLLRSSPFALRYSRSRPLLLSSSTI